MTTVFYVSYVLFAALALYVLYVVTVIVCEFVAGFRRGWVDAKRESDHRRWMERVKPSTMTDAELDDAWFECAYWESEGDPIAKINLAEIEAEMKERGGDDD